MKYIIDVPEDRISAGRLRVLADMENSMTYWIETGIRVTPYEEPSGTAEDAWKMVRHILKNTADGGMTWDDIEDCFGTDNLSHIAELSYVEALEKYDAWKKQKEEIHVGDEVRTDEVRGVVTYAATNYYGILKDNGQLCHYSEVVKTGRHFPEVAELLKEMREEG